MQQTFSHFGQLDLHHKRALLVQVNSMLVAPEQAWAEFQELALSVGVKIVTTVIGHGKSFYPKYLVGSGKAEEIKQEVQLHQIEIVLFNHELTPVQRRNLEKLLSCRVLDRTTLILNIFAQRARTFEGKLQVELAQLSHMRSNLVRGWTHLERQKGGIGLRGGPGETQLEVDRRLLDNRLRLVSRKLEKVVRQRDQQRRARARSGVPTVSLVGYTNAGKSTLFNCLTHSSVYVENQLFATLDPTLRRLHLPPIGNVILADTVGFIRDLPHDLIAAFRATLEETRQADLLLHIIDASDDNTEQYRQNVDEVLREIKADNVPQLLVYNKIDLLPTGKPRVDYDEYNKPKRVWISAVTGEGLDLLQQAIAQLLSQQFVQAYFILHKQEGKLRAMLYAMNVVQAETIDDKGRIILEVSMLRADYERVMQQRPDADQF